VNCHKQLPIETQNHHIPLKFNHFQCITCQFSDQI